MSFSVVIPLFNKAPHIERAINSVLNQTLQDFEIIVVNDGSTDNGQEIVREFHDPRIRLINQENQGVSVARNRGIEKAKFDLVAFLDADDEWLPEFLRDIQVLVNNFPDCGAFATASRTVRPNGKVSYLKINILPPPPWVGIIPDFFELFQLGYAFNSSSIVVPKKVLKEIGGFPAGIALSEDVDCWVKIALRYTIAFTPAINVTYHQESQNRAGHRLQPLFEMPYISTIRNALEMNTVPKHLVKSSLDFIAQKQIMVATNNIMAGNPTYGRRLLATCRNTKKYFWIWVWWCFWASIPAGWPKKLLNMKQRLLGE